MQGAVARGVRTAGPGELTGEAQLPGEPQPASPTALGRRAWWLGNGSRSPLVVAAPAHILHLLSHKRSEVCPNHRQTDLPTSPH